MSTGLRLRLFRHSDLAFADSLRALAGWNQTPADWERFLLTSPTGCFLAEWEGSPAGTATTTVYGPDLAWIGMVLVHPTFRRRGIGGALLKRCIDHLREQGVRCLKLDATPLGKPIYDNLGFRDEWTLRRWVRPSGFSPRTTGDPHCRPWNTGDASRVQALDTVAFGVSRQGILPALARQSSWALIHHSSPRRVDGYGLLRPGARASYLGPVVADSAEPGLRLAGELATGSGDQELYWDIPDPNTPAVAWAKQHGFTVQRTLTRMFLGENRMPGDPRRQFALAGPEIG